MCGQVISQWTRKERQMDIRANGVAGHSWNEFASIVNAISAHGELLAEEGDTLALALPLTSPDHSQHQKSHQDWQ